MAGVGVFVAAPSAVTLVSGTAKTALQIIAASEQAVMIKGVQITCDGTSSVATPGIIQLLRQTSAGTMSSATPVKSPRADEGETLQTTATYNASVEPSASDIDRTFHVHPQLGFVYEFPYGDFLKVGGGTRMGLKANFAAAVDILPSMWMDE